ncbi:ATP/GTP-binding protein [Lyngbya sp. PCC 8106]|uniref:AAA family ATPase n=1 Tax=Lyngbya sp. (strain PCC 8106) TaxID=313612 RepID=UPI0000EAA3E4|nr:ATP-binding protein [Lyngbya sp. PCC 8106]EAW34429.1 abortive infection protein, putative [Lyngbya sp. PCC 8106]
MLIEFSVGNYLSFQDIVTFSLVTAKIPLPHKKLRNNRVKIDDQLSLLKTAIIYGENGSGKTNLIKALNLMTHWVLNSVQDTAINSIFPIQPFRLNSKTINQPSRFEIVILIEKIIYRYGFEIYSEEVIAEWLYYVPEHQEVPLLKRELNQFEFFPPFPTIPELTPQIKPHNLLLSFTDQFHIEIMQEIWKWFHHNLKIIPSFFPNLINAKTIKSWENTQYQDQIIQFLKRFNLGIDAIEIEPFLDQKTNQPVVKIIRSSYDQQRQQTSSQTFDLYQEESLGTQKLLQLAIILVEALNSGQVIWIDSLDLNLHPLITKTIIELFHQRETNPQNAQLIFTAYDTSLLTPKLFRRDQIWFTTRDIKNQISQTELYALAEFKIKNDSSYDQDYLLGKYGGIPL